MSHVIYESNFLFLTIHALNWLYFLDLQLFSRSCTLLDFVHIQVRVNSISYNVRCLDAPNCAEW